MVLAFAGTVDIIPQPVRLVKPLFANFLFFFQPFIIMEDFFP